MKKVIVIAFLTAMISFAFAEEFFPSNILMMDEKFAHHVILVEKATHKVHLYENGGTNPKLIKTYNTATGKFKGDKSINGDHKTPEGIYSINDFFSKEELLRRHGKYAEIYGAGAFPMNYPNFIDERAGKTGGGIWLHSTHDDNRISKGLDSKGCVVLQNADLRDISQYIEIEHTPIIVVQDVLYLARPTWDSNRTDINAAVEKWAKAWQTKDFETYISSYDSLRFKDRSKGNYSAYKAYKKAVFSRPDSPNIKLEFISIMANLDYAVIQMQQNYQSSIINDIGMKTLYLQKDANYEWKIVGELWSKAGHASIAFTPSKRFFKD